MILDDPEKLRLALRRRAMDLLARREHTRHELSHKLTLAVQKSQRRHESQQSDASPEHHNREQEFSAQQQQKTAELISQVLDRLEQDNLLSDSRFTEAYVNGRLNTGYGPLYIRHQLRQKHVDATLLENNLQSFDQQQWIDQLSALITRRLSAAGLPQRGTKEYLKLQRFVLSRGFTASQWYEVEKRFRSP